MSETVTGQRRMWPTPQAYNERGSRAAYVAAGKGGMDLVTAVRLPDVDAVSPQLTLFAEAFPASPIPWLADEKALRTRATSGQSSPDSFARLGPDGWLPRTSQDYCQPNLDGSLAVFSETWPRAGMTRNGTAYRLLPLAPLTDETGCGWLPTPAAQSYGTNQGGGLGRVGPVRPSLQTMARQNRWPIPTPTAGDAKSAGSRNTAASAAHFGVSLTDYVRGDEGRGRMWPTPAARDYRSPSLKVGQPEYFRAPTSGIPLPEAIGGQLNPTWVSVLMGYPPDWTEIG